jgi:hypothetical protein
MINTPWEILGILPEYLDICSILNFIICSKELHNREQYMLKGLVDRTHPCHKHLPNIKKALQLDQWLRITYYFERFVKNVVASPTPTRLSDLTKRITRRGVKFNAVNYVRIFDCYPITTLPLYCDCCILSECPEVHKNDYYYDIRSEPSHLAECADCSRHFDRL